MLAAALTRSIAQLEALDRRAPLMVPAALFLASATFTFVRNTQDGILWDMSYILNTASRIAAGDVPYAQFPLAHAPLTFMTQALLIRLFGPHFFLQIIYACVAGGLATALTWGIVRRMLEGAVLRPRALAAVLCIPLVPLGVYAIFPHPFYDPDTCLWMLVALTALFVARGRQGTWGFVIAGALLVVPTFFKQNIGLMFLALAFGALVLEAAVVPSRRAAAAKCALGAAGCLVLAALAIQLVIGLGTYLHWIIEFATAQRPVALTKLAPLVDPRRSGLFAVGFTVAVLAARVLPAPLRPFALIAGLGVPFLLRAVEPWSGAAIVDWWPPILSLATLGGLACALRAGVRLEATLGLVAAGVATATFLSNGLLGSTYGVFPLMIIALASVIVAVPALAGSSMATASGVFGTAVAACLLVAGFGYSLSGQYNLWHTVGVPVRAAYPSLQGLAAPGPYLLDLDTLLRWIDVNVPVDEPAVFIPGEDPIYYALGRRPPLPVVLFEGVANPYPAEQLVVLGRNVGLRWVFVKVGALQLGSQDERAIIAAFAPSLTSGFVEVGRVGAYAVFRRP